MRRFGAVFFSGASEFALAAVRVLRFGAALVAFGSSSVVSLRVRRAGFSAAGNANAEALVSSPAVAAVRPVDDRRRAGFVRFGTSAGATRLGGGGAKAGGGGSGRGVIARTGSGGAVLPVGCAPPSDETSKM